MILSKNSRICSLGMLTTKRKRPRPWALGPTAEQDLDSHDSAAVLIDPSPALEVKMKQRFQNGVKMREKQSSQRNLFLSPHPAYLPHHHGPWSRIGAASCRPSVALASESLTRKTRLKSLKVKKPESTLSSEDRLDIRQEVTLCVLMKRHTQAQRDPSIQVSLTGYHKHTSKPERSLTIHGEV